MQTATMFEGLGEKIVNYLQEGWSIELDPSKHGATTINEKYIEIPLLAAELSIENTKETLWLSMTWITCMFGLFPFRHPQTPWHYHLFKTLNFYFEIEWSQVGNCMKTRRISNQQSLHLQWEIFAQDLKYHLNIDKKFGPCKSHAVPPVKTAWILKYCVGCLNLNIQMKVKTSKTIAHVVPLM